MTQIVNDSGMSVAWILNRVPPHALSATLLAKGTFLLRPKGTAQPADRQEPLSGDRHRNDDGRSLLAPSDFVPYKPKTDLLLTGHCHAPGEKGLARCTSTFGVGEWKKSLTVSGDRTWEKTAGGIRPSLPEAFRRISIRPENSFGGPGFADNPLGAGFLAELPGEDAFQALLPNVEYPEEMITAPEDRPRPAGFGPLPTTDPSRWKKRGKYDETWEKDHWPWLPLDFDWSHFNSAPPDQQWDAPLRGNERLFMENLHPDLPTYTSRLPGLRLRWFLKETLESVSRFREVEMKIDTLRVDMDREELVLVWRGVTPVASRSLEEISHQYVVSERLESIPVSPEHYAHCLEGRLSPPPDRSLPWKPLGEIEAEKLPRDWKDQFDAAFAHAEERLERAESEVGPTAEHVDPDWDAILSAFDEIGESERKELPSPTELRDESESWKQSAGKKTEARTQWERERWTRESFLARAKHDRDFSRQDLSGLDLSGADLAGTIFRNAILPGTRMGKCNLQGADFTRANLRRAELGESDLSEAVLTSADLDEANLSRARLVGTRLDGASLTHAVLRGSDLTGASAERASFHQADLVAAILKGVRCAGADFSLTHIGNARFDEADMTNASVEGAKGAGISLRNATLTKLHAGKGADFSQGNFSGANAVASTWEESTLTGADFQGAVLNRANFNDAGLKGANFNKSDLVRARFRNANLEEATLVQVNLFRGSLEGAKMKGANLQHSNLYGVELWDADDADANYSSANLKGTKRGG